MRRLKAILVFIATLAFLASPFWAVNFRGYDPAAFPFPPDDPAIQPAGWAFSIWGLVYLWLLVSAVAGLLRSRDDPRFDAPRWGMFISLGLGASWLQMAMAAPVIATAQIWLMTAAALLAQGSLAKEPDTGELLTLQLPTGLYTGWLTAASGVGTGVVLIGYGVGSETVISLIMLALIAVIAIIIMLTQDPPLTYPIGIIWALAGVIAANWGHNIIMLPAALCIVVLIVLAAVRFWPKARSAQ